MHVKSSSWRENSMFIYIGFIVCTEAGHEKVVDSSSELGPTICFTLIYIKKL